MFEPGDEYEIQTINCPFDPAHFMPKSTFLRHIDKCKSVNRSQFKQCPYDVYHIIKKQYFDIHLKNCQSKNINIYQESVWEEDCEYDQENPDENQQTIANWQNQNVLTDSILQKGKTKFATKHNQSQLLKALQNINFKQQSEDQNTQYWADVLDGKNPQHLQQPSYPSANSHQFNNSKLSKKAPLEKEMKKSHAAQDLGEAKVGKSVNQKMTIQKSQTNKMKEIIKRPSKVYASCVGPSKPNKNSSYVGQGNQFGKQFNDPLSMSYHPDVNLKSPQRPRISNFHYDSELSRSSVYEFPQHMQYNQNPPEFYSQVCNNFMVNNQYIVYGHAGHNPSYATPNFTSYPMPNQLSYPTPNQTSYPIPNPPSYPMPNSKTYFYPHYGVNEVNAEFDQSHKWDKKSSQKKTEKERKQKKEQKEQQKKQKSQKEREKKTKKKKQ